jgi:hypothetical protein
MKKSFMPRQKKIAARRTKSLLTGRWGIGAAILAQRGSSLQSTSVANRFWQIR